MQPRTRRLLSLGSAILLGGCGGDGPAGPGGTPPTTASVDVGNIFFESGRNASTDPAIDTVAIGGTVTWTWIEAGSHTVRFDDDALSDSPTLGDDGSAFSISFPAAGTYTYDCAIHGLGMTGSIVVK